MPFAGRTLEHESTVSVLPADFQPPPSGTTVSHIELSPAGGYAFVGNRVGVGVDGSCGDAVEGNVEGAISVPTPPIPLGFPAAA